MNDAARPTGFHVLLVEDHAMLRGIMEQTLMTAGFHKSRSRWMATRLLRYSTAVPTQTSF